MAGPREKPPPRGAETHGFEAPTGRGLVLDASVLIEILAGSKLAAALVDSMVSGEAEAYATRLGVTEAPYVTWQAASAEYPGKPRRLLPLAAAKRYRLRPLLP